MARKSLNRKNRKIRAVNKANGERGERLTTNITYGYKRNPDDPKARNVDEEAAQEETMRLCKKRLAQAEKRIVEPDRLSVVFMRTILPESRMPKAEQA